MSSLLDDPTIALARLTVAQYHHMIASGVLIDGDPLELYEGVLVAKMTEGPAHSFRITKLARLLIRALGDSAWQVRVQHPISTGDSEPEPDIAIVADLDYSQRHPGPSDIAALIEVAGSSLTRDRSTKQRIYANAGIERYVIVSLLDGLVEVYTEPMGGADPRYGCSASLAAGAVHLGPVSVDIADLFN
jgi:Uma2 family endonuclease